MAYFQGRDVRVAFTTEHYSLGIKNTNGDLAVTGHQDGPTDVGPTDLVKNRKWPMHRGGAASGSDTALGLVDADEVTDTEASTDEINTLSDLTAVEVGVDKTDEDIAYFGQNTKMMAEIKKVYTISITRKKSNNDFEALYRSGRMGILAYTSSSKIEVENTDLAGHLDASNADAYEIVNSGADGTKSAQKWTHMGYRVHVKEKHAGAIMTFRNCCISGYSVSLSPEGIQEETLEFYSEVDAKHVGGDANANTTLTTLTEL
jgi:hypothetical protein|tara:strand:+ start:3576 stop:4355 length:780 start_codon:yes stop_codon:yes gene_type:complete